MGLLPITDDLGDSAPNVKVDFSDPSSLFNYLKVKVANVVVVPDFIQRAALPLHVAAPNPISFTLELSKKATIPGTKPEIDLVPNVQASIRANVTPGTDSPFPAVSTPSGAVYVGLTLEGSLDVSARGAAGDATFGLDVTLESGLDFWRAFDANTTLGKAVTETLSNCFVPWSVDALARLKENDVCTISGSGSLKVSGSFSVSAAPNPLASVDLPLNAGSVQVKPGAMAGITASCTIEGSYQVRLRRTSGDVIELSVYKKDGTTLTAGLSGSAGLGVNFGNTDLIKSLLGAIGTEPIDQAEKKLLGDGGLTNEEIATLADAIKGGVDHSLQASLDLALSQMSSEEAAFQYELRPAEMDDAAKAAVARALTGDFTALPLADPAGGPVPIRSGVRMTSSVLTDTRKARAVLHLNLFGLVNLLSVTDLIRKSVVISDPATGDLTIADSATASRIDAAVEPMRRHEQIRKAAFDSLMMTAAYRVSNTVSMTGLTSRDFHFFADVHTSPSTFEAYIRWFVALNLLRREDTGPYLQQFSEGAGSACLLRTAFDDNGCEAMFFQDRQSRTLWNKAHYWDYARQALSAVIDPGEPEAPFRLKLLNASNWEEAFREGAQPAIVAPLAGLDITDPRLQPVLADVATITWWANAMEAAGQALVHMQNYLDTHPAGARAGGEFDRERTKMQKAIANALAKSHGNPKEPWGIVALDWAAGSPPASGKIVAGSITIAEPVAVVAAATTANP